MVSPGCSGDHHTHGGWKTEKRLYSLPIGQVITRVPVCGESLSDTGQT